MRTPNAALAAFLFVTTALALPAAHAAACTVFAVASDETVVGANLDWPDDLEGYVLVNPRGVEKTFVPWSGFEQVAYEGDPVTWVSRYASITLTGCARDFVEGGMNEAGLIIDQANAPAVHPPDDGRIGVSSQQWLQYALDTYGSVDELVDGLDDVRQDGEGWHYLTVDRAGDWAVIEFIEGEPVVYRSGRCEFPVIANALYEQTMEHVPLDVRFGGDLDIGAGEDSYARVVRVAERLRDRRAAWLHHGAPPGDTGPEAARMNSLGRVDFAFELLDDVSAPDTQRSVVYDTGAMRVHWNSWRHDDVRFVRMTSATRDTTGVVRAVPVHAELAGDATAALQPLSDKQNEELLEYVRQLFGQTDGGAEQTE